MKKAAAAWLLGWALFGFPWTGATLTPHVERVSWTPFRRVRPVDQVLNFAYYVPVGLLGRAAAFAPLPIVGAAALLSATTEVSQVFSTNRYPSTTDLLLNTGGALAGVILAAAFTSRR